MGTNGTPTPQRHWRDRITQAITQLRFALPGSPGVKRAEGELGTAALLLDQLYMCFPPGMTVIDFNYIRAALNPDFLPCLLELHALLIYQLDGHTEHMTEVETANLVHARDRLQHHIAALTKHATDRPDATNTSETM